MARDSWIGRLVLVAGGAAGGLMLVEACSEPVGRMLVEAGTAMMDAGGDEPGEDGLLSDAGALLRDAGMALVDAGSDVRDGASDAAAQPAASAYKSGSRIQMRTLMYEGTDGSRYAAYTVPYDMQLNASCNVTKTVDGKLRCIPPTAPISQPTPYYADSGCTTQPLFGVSDLYCQLPLYLSLTEALTDACVGSGLNGVSTGVRVYQRGAKHTGNYYFKAGASCVSMPQTPGIAFYSQGAEVPLSSFVEFTDAAPVTL